MYKVLNIVTGPPRKLRWFSCEILSGASYQNVIITYLPTSLSTYLTVHTYLQLPGLRNDVQKGFGVTSSGDTRVPHVFDTCTG